MDADSDVLSVGTLKKDATLFFSQCENLMGSSRLQHTKSMMELPTNFIREIIRERDEEYALYENKSDDDDVYDNLYDNQNNGLPKPNGDDTKVIDDKDEDGDEYEYYYEDEEHQYPNGNGNKNNKNITNIDTKTNGHSNGQLRKKRKPYAHRSSNYKPKGLPLKNEDSESVADQQDSTPIVCGDSTPIIQPIIPPPAPPQSNGPLNPEWILDNRRRSGGITKSQQNLLKDRLNSSNKVKYHPNTNMTKLTSIDDAEIDQIFSDCSDYEQDEEKNTFDMSESESHTMSLDEELWNNDLDTSAFQECNIRFEEDECLDGSKFQDASQFVSLQFFFQFVYDRFHSYSQFLLDTSLPTYNGWKKMRKVRIRNASLRTVDYALKGCLASVDIIKAVVRNCLICCVDPKQTSKQFIYEKCREPKIIETKFNIGNFSILAAWDLFDNGSSPSINDWTTCLSIDEGNAQYLALCLPDLSHLHSEMKKVSQVFHNGKAYKFNIICEFLNSNDKYFKFGVGPIEWRVIKQKFVELHGIKYNNPMLRAFDALNYFINPQIKKLNELMSDKNDKFVSKRRIIAEPIMWLFYMVSLLVQRQEKLQNLYITSMSYCSDHNNHKGQKLNALISSLAKQAKDESERLRAIMAKLPGTDDLKQTLINLVKTRDQKKVSEYTKSLDIYEF